MSDRRPYSTRGFASTLRASEERSREELHRRALAIITAAGSSGVLSETLHDELKTRWPRPGQRKAALEALRTAGQIVNAGRAKQGHGIVWIASKHAGKVAA